MPSSDIRLKENNKGFKIKKEKVILASPSTPALEKHTSFVSDSKCDVPTALPASQILGFLGKIP